MLSLFQPACIPGFYKAYAGNIKCSKCPPHSFSYAEGSSICHCEKGFYRARKDPPTMACTRKYYFTVQTTFQTICIHENHEVKFKDELEKRTLFKNSTLARIFFYVREFRPVEFWNVVRTRSTCVFRLDYSEVPFKCSSSFQSTIHRSSRLKSLGEVNVFKWQRLSPMFIGATIS